MALILRHQGPRLFEDRSDAAVSGWHVAQRGLEPEKVQTARNVLRDLIARQDSQPGCRKLQRKRRTFDILTNRLDRWRMFCHNKAWLDLARSLREQIDRLVTVDAGVSR